MHQPRIEYEGVTALNDLAHGEFGKWLETINLSYQESRKFIKVYDEFDSNYVTSRNLGLNALEMIATLPEEERTKEHTTSMGAKLVKT